mmetsp:Transcript_86756/g.172253  ORF Transcript_86756/g.172253 Transcript_86756/m.172253 type:complete len:186 (+) Transcript_86756:1007-1564(+)
MPRVQDSLQPAQASFFMKHRRLVLLQHRVSQQFSFTAEQLELLAPSAEVGDNCDGCCCCHAVGAVAAWELAAPNLPSADWELAVANLPKAGAEGLHAAGVAGDSELADATVPSAGADGMSNGGLTGGTPDTTPGLASLESCAVTLIMHLKGQPLRPAWYHTHPLHSTMPWHIAQHISGVGMWFNA